MSGWMQVTTAVLCPWCHRRFGIEQSMFNKWLHRIKMCPFCGRALAANDADMESQGYERHEG